MDTNVFQIPADNLGDLIKTLDKLARKSAKLGLAPISYTLGATTDRPYYRAHFDEGGSLATGSRLKEYVVGKNLTLDAQIASGDVQLTYIRYTAVTVMGETPRLAGWEFVGTLQHLADDKGEVINLLRTVPGFKAKLPEKFRTASPENCDHCHKVIRTRKETFVVRKEETGDFLQVGRNCTQDFLGGKDPAAVAAALQYLLQAMDTAEAGEEFGGGGGHVAVRYGMGQFLAIVAMLVRTEGWTSRGKSRQSEGVIPATADLALQYLTPPIASKAYAEWKQWVAEHPVTDVDKEISTKAMDYAHDDLAAKADRNDYEHNLYVATTQATIDHRLAGISASLIPYYLREVERQVIRTNELRQVAHSEFVGVVGEKVTVTVQCAKIITCETQFGVSFLHRLITPEGSLVVWFSSNSENNLQPGTTALIRATVKKHEIRNNVKQTVVTRLVTMTPEQVAEEAAKAAKKAARAAKKAGTQAIAA